MRLSRSMLNVPTVLLGPLLVLTSGITGGCQRAPATKTVGKRTLKCDTTVKVTPGALHGVDKDIYVCDDPNFNQVSWVAPQGVTFSVQFPSTAPADCPFNPCPASITDSTPQTVGPQPADLTVYKYTITVTVGGKTTPYDPHVVGGGGY